MAKRNPHGIVEIGGTRYDSWVDKQFFRQVTVEQASNMASEALFRCFDPRFHFLDKYTTDDGVPMLLMRFWMGFGEDLGEPLFKGLLARVERGDSDTTFRAYDMGYKMRQEKKTEFHRNMHDLQIIRKLATRNGLAFVGPDQAPPLDPHESLIHDSQNDWEHSMERARHAGFILYVRGDTLFCKDPAKVGSPLITLRYRKETREVEILHNFDLSFKIPENQQGRHREVEHRGRHHGGRRLTGNSRKHKRGTKLNEVRHDLEIHTKTMADRRAHASKELQREHAFTCTVRSIPPLPGVRPDVRDTIALENLGELFSGPYLCDKVTHDLVAGQSFTTEYTLYRDTRNG